MNTFRNHILVRLVACVLAFTLPVMGFPFWAFKQGPKVQKQPKAAPETRVLTNKEMRCLQGKGSANPYIAGNAKWSVIHNGVDVTTGNFTTSATDLSFEGGYGIPVNVTRTYSCNNGDEGGFGRGWTLSADIRSTAGGLLKSSGAPVRSVPIQFRERPPLETDASLGEGGGSQPVEAVISTDASGKVETIQKDCDGILTTPAWDKNNTEPEYEFIEHDGNLYQVMVSNVVTTPEGTVYVYSKHGEFLDGMFPYSDPEEEDMVPGNILKIDTATDRHGNETAYTYGGTGEFARANGIAVEDLLTLVEMPNGHEIEFTWDELDTDIYRIVSISDGDRTVEYGYDGTERLTSVTTPAGLETTYTYANAATTTEIGGTPAPDLLSSITDPRGMTTEIGYVMSLAIVLPYGVEVPTIMCWMVALPNGVTSYYQNTVGEVPEASPYYGLSEAPASYMDCIGEEGEMIMEGHVAWVLPSYGHEWLTLSSLTESGTQEWYKDFDPFSQDLLKDQISIRPTNSLMANDLRGDRQLPYQDYTYQRVTTTNTYNFMGNPLSKSVAEYQNGGTGAGTVTRTTYYAYWAQEKYYQQKAVKDVAGRFTFTDYYDDEADDGLKGQVWRVYDPKHCDFSNTGGGWQDALVPTYADDHSAEFDYDANGRPTDVWKLQDTNSYAHNGGTNWDYVQTHTTYGADDTPWWGGATVVVEDYGGIGRTTETLAYDAAGRAVEVEDAAGKVFYTVYDDDGKVQSVTRTDTNPDVPIVTYSYGTTGIENGMVTSVTDELSGAEQVFTYGANPGGSPGTSFVERSDWGAYGQVTGVAEDDGSWEYTVAYEYNSMGERSLAVYDTPNGDRAYAYRDYIAVGPDAMYKRVFQTMNKQTLSGSDWIDTTEEFHYSFDQAGRLSAAAFCQTPQSSPGDYSVPADLRTLAVYNYDPAGRALAVEHYWQDWGGLGSYTTTNLLRQAYAYENTSPLRGLRTSTAWQVDSSGSWSTQRTEYYGYDADLDYLLNVDYNDGVANEYQEWEYDDAGNRSDDSVLGSTWTYDSLNRMTASPSHTYTNDILGNRTGRDSGAYAYTWDILNRLKLYAVGNEHMDYTYRADGIRIRRDYVEDYTHEETEAEDYSMWYAYDGQMQMDSYEIYGDSSYKRTSYGLGARGIDYISTYNGSTTVTGFPIYDGHGNMIATIGRSGSGPYYALSDQRSYDVWGQIRSGSSTGDPKMRYCANLGHPVDDESGLIYMRARYYEPWTGRFVNADPTKRGPNWFIYASNNPVNLFDPTGNDSIFDYLTCYLVADLIGLIGTAVSVLGLNNALAEGFAIVEYPAVAWAGGVGLFTVIGIWGAAKTLQWLVNTANGISYHAALIGAGDAVLEIIGKAKQTGVLAILAHNMEISAWLGVIDSGGM